VSCPPYRLDQVPLLLLQTSKRLVQQTALQRADFLREQAARKKAEKRH